MTAQPRKVQLLAVVWGEWHIARFLGFCLPSLMAPGNITAISKTAPVALDIATTQSDLKHFERQPVLNAAAAHATVTFQSVPAEPQQLPLEFVHVMWEHYRKKCQAENSLLVIVIPDDVYSGASLARCMRHLATGEASFHTRPKFRVIRDTMEPELLRRRSHDGAVLDISGAQLAELSVKHMHASNATCISDNVVRRLAMEQHFRTPDTAFVVFDTLQEPSAMDPLTGEVGVYFATLSAAKGQDWCVEMEDALGVSLTPFCYTWNYLSVFGSTDARDLARMTSAPVGTVHPSLSVKRLASKCRRFDGGTAAGSPYPDPVVAAWEDEVFDHQRLQEIWKAAVKVDPMFGRLLMLAYVSDAIRLDEIVQNRPPGSKFILSVDLRHPGSSRDLASIGRSELRGLVRDSLGVGSLFGDTLVAKTLAGRTVTRTTGNRTLITRFGDLIVVDEPAAAH